ncbi:hypothetical protein K466DRAFT_42962 [Polyporus arcularius HHB13444]|uniref:Uncharacterized protein n=1 Tax=Polyporus arcularius HHB13444 TaxID=1314778 RepID=A0A5C3NRL2_9APHY|nr:hypothetical protein K466DRAFT_42962 [Polyporus arcularius HHB13444]
MDAQAAGDPETLRMRVLSYREGDVLPSDVHVGTARSCPCPPAARDHDPSAVRVRHGTPTPTSLRREDAREGSFVLQYTLDYFARSIGNDWPRYRVAVGDDKFLIARPIFDTAGVTGRGTRAYIAWPGAVSVFRVLQGCLAPTLSRV